MTSSSQAKICDMWPRFREISEHFATSTTRSVSCALVTKIRGCAAHQPALPGGRRRTQDRTLISIQIKCVRRRIYDFSLDNLLLVSEFCVKVLGCPKKKDTKDIELNFPKDVNHT